MSISNVPISTESPGVKSVYTTGEVAQICKVSQQTIIRCFDSGSRFRRIPRECLIQFMKENGIPLDNLESGKKRVLVVDDDQAIVEMLVELLERDGRFEVKTASSGYDAGLLTHEFRPDMLILDFKLPDINGNVVCRTLRSNPAFEHVKVIIISGVVDRDEIDQLLSVGADDFLQKPFQIDELLGRMTRLLNV